MNEKDLQKLIPLRLTLIVGGADIGGSELQLVQHAIEMQKIGHQVSIVFLKKSSGLLISKLDEAKIEYTILHESGSIHALPFSLLRLIKHLKSRKVEIINAYLPEAQIFAFLAVYFSKHNRPKLICSVRGQFGKRAWVIEKLLYLSFHSSSAVLINTKSLENLLYKRFGLPSKVSFCIRNGVSLTSQPIANYDSSETLYLANFLPYKGHEEFLEHYMRSNFDIGITFVGGGRDRQQFDNIIARHSKDKKLALSPLETNPRRIFSQCGFAIHPSKSEGLSNAILEEMTSGLAVVAFDIGGNSELIEHEFNGYLIEEGDFDLFLYYMAILSKDRALRRKLGLNAYKSARRFDWKVNSLQMTNLYHQVKS